MTGTPNTEPTICNLAPVPVGQLLIWVWLASIASDMACSAVSRLVKDDARREGYLGGRSVGEKDGHYL